MLAAGNGSYYEIHRFTAFNETTVLFYGLNCMVMRGAAFVGFRTEGSSPFGLWVAVAGKGIYVINVTGKVVVKTYNTASGNLSGNGIRDVLPLSDTACVLAGDRLDILTPATVRSEAFPLMTTDRLEELLRCSPAGRPNVGSAPATACTATTSKPATWQSTANGTAW